ncbi:MAG TPA: iron ABC transporter permease, partial [Methanobacterium subterraneum]|nr:iron ABC transporter permease [Methanobacterium subterraneum]
MFKTKIKEHIAAHNISVTMILCIPLIILFFLSFLVGRYPIAPYDVVI